MGIVVQQVTFDDRVPEAARVGDMLTRMIGLPVTVSESDSEVRGTLFELRALGILAFSERFHRTDCLPTGRRQRTSPAGGHRGVSNRERGSRRERTPWYASCLRDWIPRPGAHLALRNGAPARGPRRAPPHVVAGGDTSRVWSPDLCNRTGSATSDASPTTATGVASGCYLTSDSRPDVVPVAYVGTRHASVAHREGVPTVQEPRHRSIRTWILMSPPIRAVFQPFRDFPPVGMALAMSLFCLFRISKRVRPTRTPAILTSRRLFVLFSTGL